MSTVQNNAQNAAILADAIDQLTKAEADESAEVTAVIQYIATVPSLIATAVAEAKAAGATPEQIASMTAVADIIKSDAARMNAALQAPPVVPTAAPVITSATSDTGSTTSAYSYQITATNSPTGFSAAGLPNGLSMSPAGLISGTPAIAGTSLINIGAINAAGTGTAVLSLSVGA